MSETMQMVRKLAEPLASRDDLLLQLEGTLAPEIEMDDLGSCAAFAGLAVLAENWADALAESDDYTIASLSQDIDDVVCVLQQMRARLGRM